MKYRFVIGMLFAVVFAAGTSAQSWFVRPEGSQSLNGSPEQPFATIQQALDAAQDADTIVLLPGVYTGAGNYDLQSSGLSLTIRSSEPDNWDVVEATIIDPAGAGGIFVFENTSALVLEGLTLQNAVKDAAFYDLPHGAALFCDGVVATIRYCIFRNCVAAGLGGAIYFGDSQATVSHCIFAGNQSWDGGSLISDSGSNVKLEHCTIAGNTSVFYGGGVSCEFSSTLTTKNSIFWGNALAAPEGRGRQIFAGDSGIVQIDYTAVEEGLNGTDYNGQSLIIFGEGLIEADPQFAFFDSDASSVLWDFRLKSAFGRWNPAIQAWVSDTETSPCINGGQPGSDYSRELWPNGRRADAGAYGNTPHASLYGNIADLDVSGRVDMTDMALLASVWLGDPVDYENFDGQTVVDAADLLILAENWLWEMPLL
jgi:hypothetical protein